MNKIPNELRYTRTHEWIRMEDNGVAVIGITDHAQSALGDLVFVDLPESENLIHAGDDVCVVESVKAASDVYSPLSGKIVAINEELEEAPGLVNSDPYGDGWLFKIEPVDTEELNELLDAEGYEGIVEEDED